MLRCDTAITVRANLKRHSLKGCLTKNSKRGRFVQQWKIELATVIFFYKTINIGIQDLNWMGIHCTCQCQSASSNLHRFNIIWFNKQKLLEDLTVPIHSYWCVIQEASHLSIFKCSLLYTCILFNTCVFQQIHHRKFHLVTLTEVYLCFVQYSVFLVGSLHLHLQGFRLVSLLLNCANIRRISRWQSLQWRRKSCYLNYYSVYSLCFWGT